MKERIATAALCLLATCSFAASPSALDRRWVYLHLYKPMTDEALFSKATNIVATAAAHSYTGVMFSSAFGLTSYHLWNDDRKGLFGRLVAFVDSFGLEKGVEVTLGALADGTSVSTLELDATGLEFPNERWSTKLVAKDGSLVLRIKKPSGFTLIVR